VPEKSEESRIEQFEKAGKDIIWPDISCPYLFDLLMGMGAYTNLGMGHVPLSWQEMESWQEQNGIRLKPWELGIIRKSSAAYVHQLQVATKPDCPPPGKVVEQDQNQLAKHIKGILR
jgi:hypothetical protein